MKLRVRAFGLAVGVVSGIIFFLATIIDVVRDKGITLMSIQSFFFGYEISYGGAVIGLIWGCIYGFIIGASIAWLYNVLHKMLYKTDISAS